MLLLISCYHYSPYKTDKIRIKCEQVSLASDRLGQQMILIGNKNKKISKQAQSRSPSYHISDL